MDCDSTNYEKVAANSSPSELLSLDAHPGEENVGNISPEELLGQIVSAEDSNPEAIPVEDSTPEVIPAEDSTPEVIPAEDSTLEVIPAEDSNLEAIAAEDHNTETISSVEDEEKEKRAEKENNEHKDKEKGKENKGLPFSRVRAIINSDDQVGIVSKAAVILITKATELFISQLSTDAARHLAGTKRKTIQLKDIAAVTGMCDEYAFLDGISLCDMAEQTKKPDDKSTPTPTLQETQE